MSLHDLITLMRDKHYLFEVVVPGKASYARLDAGQVDQRSGRLEAYFTGIAQAHQAKTLTIHLYARNGRKCFLKKGIVTIDMPSIMEPSMQRMDTAMSGMDQSMQHMEAPMTNMDTAMPGMDQVTPHMETSMTNIDTAMLGMDQVTPHMETSMTNMDTGIQKSTHALAHQNFNRMITKADIEVVQLRTENKYLGEKVDELKTRNKELERKNDEYYNENLRLTREHATEKDKRDLEFKHKELDLATKQKQGLSGILDDVKTMPAEAWQFIAGLMPNHPMAKGLAPSNEPPQLNGPAKHPDPDAQACIEVIDALLLKQTPEITGMAAMLIEHLTNNPGVLKAVYEKFFPGQTTEQTSTPGN